MCVSLRDSVQSYLPDHGKTANVIDICGNVLESDFVKDLLSSILLLADITR